MRGGFEMLTPIAYTGRNLTLQFGSNLTFSSGNNTILETPSYSGSGRGARKIYNSFSGLSLRGVYSSTVQIYTGTARGGFVLRAGFTCQGRGSRKIYMAFGANKFRGVYVINLPTYNNTLRGAFTLGLNSYVLQSRGKFIFHVNYAQNMRGLNRIADNDLAQYELYRGVDGEADLSGDPFETFSSLPHETAALDADHEYHFVLRKRNAYNLVSQNLTEWLVTVDADGNQERIKPTAPEEISVIPAANGAAKVEAEYYYDQDGDNQATQFLIYLTSDGDDPDPETDEPEVVTMSKMSGTARLSWTSNEYDDETELKVLVRTRRVDSGPVNVDSINTTIYSTEAETDGPDAPGHAGIFFSKIAKQQQAA
jgi:hypothetical protein